MADKKSDNVEEIAKTLGMKPSEIVDVQLLADGPAAQTHDGNWTLIRDSGTLEFLGQDLGQRAEEEPKAEEPKKAAPKTSGR